MDHGRFNESQSLTSNDKRRVDFSSLNHKVQIYAIPILKRLLPDGKVEQNEYVALNPTRYDKHLGSFRINLQNGKWSDFATGDRGGDLISLWAYVRRIKQIEAARELQSIVGGTQ